MRILIKFLRWFQARRIAEAQLAAHGYCLSCGERKREGAECRDCWAGRQW